MNIQKQPNSWSCLVTAFAMAMDIPVEQLINELGHNGSEILWPNYPEPLRRRAFSFDEMMYLAYESGYTVMLFNKEWNSRPRYEAQPLLKEPPQEYWNDVLSNNIGVLSGRINGQRHAVAYEKGNCYDPNGTIYPIEKFSIETFWALFPRVTT